MARLRDASIEDITAVPGIGAATARAVLTALRADDAAGTDTAGTDTAGTGTPSDPAPAGRVDADRAAEDMPVRDDGNVGVSGPRAESEL